MLPGAYDEIVVAANAMLPPIQLRAAPKRQRAQYTNATLSP